MEYAHRKQQKATESQNSNAAQLLMRWASPAQASQKMGTSLPAQILFTSVSTELEQGTLLGPCHQAPSSLLPAAPAASTWDSLCRHGTHCSPEVSNKTKTQLPRVQIHSVTFLFLAACLSLSHLPFPCWSPWGHPPNTLLALKSSSQTNSLEELFGSTQEPIGLSPSQPRHSDCC